MFYWFSQLAARAFAGREAEILRFWNSMTVRIDLALSSIMLNLFLMVSLLIL